METGEPVKKYPKIGSVVRIGIGDNRRVVKVDSIGDIVHLRNPRNGVLTQASAHKIYEFQQGNKLLFSEKEIK